MSPYIEPREPDRMNVSKASLNEKLQSHWSKLEDCLDAEPRSARIALDGHNLDLASLIAAARYGGPVSLSDISYEAIQASADVVQLSLDSKEVVYGINTGFGGSADTRTTSLVHLQKDLLRTLQFGIIDRSGSTRPKKVHGAEPLLKGLSSPLDHASGSYMPDSWVRASMIVRLNSLAHGVSGVVVPTAEALLDLIRKNIIPQVPLRGSISASGDLSPLSYVAGVLQGKPSLNAWTDDYATGHRRLERADFALEQHGLHPIAVRPKEGLALVNGTSVSAAVGSLVMHEALCLSGLSQVLTAMSVEALRGSDESFDPVFAAVRPHWGQEESARAIRSMLKGSSMTRDGQNLEASSLRQDRYSIRTASQWIGPVLEDVNLAYEQVCTEINSATDNPLVDVLSYTKMNSPSAKETQGRMVHGGNFQARAVTSAMEKIRQATQSLGRLLFAQCTELINPATNNGLPPNLVCAEPSDSFLFKGTDIMVAALLSELGFLANPVGSHVQTAEMGNQALNSLALISARYSLDALDILAQLASAHLVALCQALDLREMHTRFEKALYADFHSRIQYGLSQHFSDWTDSNTLLVQRACWRKFLTTLDSTTTLDAANRIPGAVEALQSLLLKELISSGDALLALKQWTEDMSTHALSLYKLVRQEYAANPQAKDSLGEGTAQMYSYIRGKPEEGGLGVPFVSEETLATPRPERSDVPSGNAEDGYGTATADASITTGAAAGEDGKGLTIGDLNGRVRQAMVSGELYRVVVSCLKQN